MEERGEGRERRRRRRRGGSKSREKVKKYGPGDLQNGTAAGTPKNQVLRDKKIH